MYEIDTTTLPTDSDGQLLCPRCGKPVLLEITRHNFTPGRRGNGELAVEYDPLDDDVEEFVTDAYCRQCSWSYLDTDNEDAEDKDPATPPANAVTTLIQALQVAWWELGMFPYPSTPDDTEQIAADYLARKFRVGQRLRFVGSGMNLRAVLLDPDTEVDILHQVGTVTGTSRARAVTVRFEAYPDTPIKMYAADEEFEIVELPVPAIPAPLSTDCQEFITWLCTQLGPKETKGLQTLSPQPPTPAQTAFAAALRADTPHRRFLQALEVPHAQWTDAEWTAIRTEFAAQWPQPECPFSTPTRVWTDETGIAFEFHSDDDTWHWQVDWETGRFWLF